MRTIIDNAVPALQTRMKRANGSLSKAQREEYSTWLHDL